MDSDEDDIYPEHDEVNGHNKQNEVKMDDMEDGEEEGEEVEEEDSDVPISMGDCVGHSLTAFRTMLTSSSMSKTNLSPSQDRVCIFTV